MISELQTNGCVVNHLSGFRAKRRMGTEWYERNGVCETVRDERRVHGHLDLYS